MGAGKNIFVRRRYDERKIAFGHLRHGTAESVELFSACARNFEGFGFLRRIKECRYKRRPNAATTE
jgi:hypothetical protein